MTAVTAGGSAARANSVERACPPGQARRSPRTHPDRARRRFHVLWSTRCCCWPAVSGIVRNARIAQNMECVGLTKGPSPRSRPSAGRTFSGMRRFARFRSARTPRGDVLAPLFDSNSNPISSPENDPRRDRGRDLAEERARVRRLHCRTHPPRHGRTRRLPLDAEVDKRRACRSARRIGTCR